MKTSEKDLLAAVVIVTLAAIATYYIGPWLLGDPQNWLNM